MTAFYFACHLAAPELCTKIYSLVTFKVIQGHSRSAVYVICAGIHWRDITAFVRSVLRLEQVVASRRQ